ncbi:hypothetical protein BHE90_011568 [Fusarium euwallaceae]|uniref:Uncharacterized protein n=1 Tax=Fusarium euwallaceae TaxID=1147111 RepID=A0A430LE52_9HYPO|nr:hypothetical protein BHE90_011568 [Fusarium euwallaceae]
MPRAASEEGEVDRIDLTANPEDLMEVDDDENRAREESSLFVSNSMTPPPSTDVTFVNLVDNDDEPEVPRGRSDSSLFVHDEPEDEGLIDNENNDSDDSDDIEDMIINIENDDNDNDMNDNEDNDDNDTNDNDDENENEDNDDNHMNVHNNNNNNNNENDSDDDDNDDNENNDNNESNDDNEENEDSDDDNGSDNDDLVPSDQKDPDATLHQALDDEDLAEPNWAEACLKTCKPHWDEVAYSFLRYRRRFLNKRTELRDARTRHRQRVRDLNARIRELEARQRRRPHKKSWPEAIRLLIEQGLPSPGVRDWKDMYRLSCKEENMSWCFNPLKTHPDLKFRPPTEEENKDEHDEEETPDPGSDKGPPPNRPSLPGQSPLPGGPRQSAFERLDIEVQIKIFSYLFVFEGELVHVISRLDPHYQPTEVPRDCNGQVALLRRFYIGEESVSLTFGTIKPQELLAPLLVSKHFNHLGASLFYGANTLQHVQHVEILWIGSQRLIYKRDRQGRYTSRRTHPLAWFSEVHRLKSISIYTPESSKGYMRRKHEPPHIVEYMADKTTSQPNYRRFRALRTLQGLDYLHVLRGLNGITFWDYDKWLDLELKLPVRDWTFVRDLNNTVRRAKTEEAMELCRLRMLAPFVIGYRPRNNIMNKIENFVNQYSAGCGGQVIDLTMDDD